MQLALPLSPNGRPIAKPSGAEMPSDRALPVMLL